MWRTISIGLLISTVTDSLVLKKNLILDTDIFSDVDDAGALLLAATLPSVNLLAVNVNTQSSYSVLAVSAILAHYGRADVPIGIKRPLVNATFFDSWLYELGEYASKIAYHWSGGSLPWGHAEEAWEPVALYRKALSEAEDGSVTIASIGFLDNLSALLNSSADEFSTLDGPSLINQKVSALVAMGGSYPGPHRSYNFWGSGDYVAAHVINSWKTPITFVGDDVGEYVKAGKSFLTKGPETDPVRMAYMYYGYGNLLSSWDPLTILYAANGLGDLFSVGNEYGYNQIDANGSNHWVYDQARTNQQYLRLKVSNETAAAQLDSLFLDAARKHKKSGYRKPGLVEPAGRNSTYKEFIGLVKFPFGVLCVALISWFIYNRLKESERAANYSLM